MATRSRYITKYPKSDPNTELHGPGRDAFFRARALKTRYKSEYFSGLFVTLVETYPQARTRSDLLTSPSSLTFARRSLPVSIIN